MMRLRARYTSIMLLLLSAFVVADAVPQQSYPEMPTPPVVFQNERVVVQRMHTFPAWAGMHQHQGNQLAIVLDAFDVKYKDAGKAEHVVKYQAGDVFWIDKTTHDHRPLSNDGVVVLITFK